MSSTNSLRSIVIGVLKVNENIENPYLPAFKSRQWS